MAKKKTGAGRPRHDDALPSGKRWHGPALAAAMKDAGWTPDDLAEHLRVGRTTVYDWRRDRCPPAEARREISKALGKAQGFFLRG